jgi:ubiquinone/menaquinone biosynthesis C-methylase UbiE
MPAPHDFHDFLEIQTQTAWGKTLGDFCDWCAPRPGSRALDVGCGPGLLPALFATRHRVAAYGVDADLGLLAAALAPIPRICASIYALPFEAASFDTLTATNVLFLLGDPPRAMRELSRLLAPGGQICLLNPSPLLSMDSATRLADSRGLTGKNRDSLLGWARRAEKHARWSAEDTQHLARRAGLQLTQSALRVGPGFALFSRLVKA